MQTVNILDFITFELNTLFKFVFAAYQELQ